MAKNKYYEKKAIIESEAIEWQHKFADISMSYGDFAKVCTYFYKQGKRYGLLTEFRENGII